MWDCIIHVVVVSPIVLGYTRHVILCVRERKWWTGNETEGGGEETMVIIFLPLFFYLQEYIACTQVWIEYVAKHFTVSAKLQNSDIKFHNLHSNYLLDQNCVFIRRNVKLTLYLMM